LSHVRDQVHAFLFQLLNAPDELRLAGLQLQQFRSRGFSKAGGLFLEAGEQLFMQFCFVFQQVQQGLQQVVHGTPHPELECRVRKCFPATLP
jgi:hypothetical protein